MTLAKILKRKDASSVVVAILLAMILTQPLSVLTATPAAKILGLSSGQYPAYSPQGSSFNYYAYMVIWAVLQIIVLEVVAWAYLVLADSFKKKR